MGGSFNPAHNGHLYIAAAARKTARLDEIWWLVSPQNPLKSAAGMSAFTERLDGARKLAGRCRWLRCLDIEQKTGKSTSVDTLGYLRSICPHARLVWIMGADNLVQLPYWHRPAALVKMIDFLIMNRPGYGWQALSGRGAALLGRRHRRRHASQLAKQLPRGWNFCFTSRNRLSATALRNTENNQTCRK